MRVIDEPVNRVSVAVCLGEWPLSPRCTVDGDGPWNDPGDISFHGPFDREDPPPRVRSLYIRTAVRRAKGGDVPPFTAPRARCSSYDDRADERRASSRPCLN